MTEKKLLTKTPKTIVGIDYSLNSPAVCVANNGGTSFSDCNFYYLTGKKKYTCKTIVPSVIKKFATGKGNADKQMMYDTFKATQGINLMKVFDQEKLNNPITDIIDSYYIMRAGYENSICNDI